MEFVRSENVDGIITLHTILSPIVERYKMAKSIIHKSVRKDLSVPFLTLKGQAEDGEANSIHVGVVDESLEAIAEVGTAAWKDIERREKIGGRLRKFRHILARGWKL